MSDKKKRRAKNETPSNKLSKEDDVIARFIRFNCPTSSTVFEGNEVHYFSAKKAIDLLVESKKYGASASDSKFPNNAAAEDYLRGLLERGLFFRAKKVILKKKDKTKVDEKSKKKEKVLSNKSPKSPKPKAKDMASSGSDAKMIVNETEAAEDENTEVLKTEQDEERKRKKKVKLLFHDVQSFGLDPADVYVWVFDPTPFYKKVIGLLIVLGTIAGCLFPLWPDWLRLVIYYLSITGIALFGLLLGVALARTALFGIIWAATLGRHKLWILPNLTEDCGFFDSFKPFYTYEYSAGGAFGSDSKASDGSVDDSKKKKKKLSKNLTEECVEIMEKDENALLLPTEAKKDAENEKKKVESDKSEEDTNGKKASNSESENQDDNNTGEDEEWSDEGSAPEKSNEEKLDQTDVDSTTICKQRSVSKSQKRDLPLDDFVIIDNGTPSQ